MVKIKIELTKEQYRKILDAIYITDWVLNSCRLGQGNDEFLHEFSQLEQTLFALANVFGYGSFVQWDQENQQYFLTTIFDQTVEDKNGAFRYIDEFEEHIFWEALCERLARRDIEAEIGCEKFSAMDPFERYKMIEDFTNKYHKEFAAHGLDNLRISKPE